MDILDAFYHTVHDYPGGAEALAPRMGMTGSVLRNKADPKKDCNKPLLVDADRAMALTGDTRILDALAEAHGGVFIKVDASAHNRQITSDEWASIAGVLKDVLAFRHAGGELDSIRWLIQELCAKEGEE